MGLFLLNRKCLLLIVLTFSLVACSDNYNEEFITSASTLNKSKALAQQLENLNLVTLSYLKEEIFIVNNIIINDKKKTYGIAPEGGFYESYYIQSEKNAYENWDTITNNFIPSTIVKREDLLELLSAMKAIGITDIYHNRTNEIFTLQWGSSVMNGYQGLIFGDKSRLGDEYKASRFDDFKEVNKDTFYFAVR